MIVIGGYKMLKIPGLYLPSQFPSFLFSFLHSLYPHPRTCLFILFYFLKILFMLRGEGREKERERNINVWLPLVHPQLGTWPATQAFAVTGNQTSNPLLCRPPLNPLIWERGEGRERERERNIDELPLLHAPWSNQQPEYVPWPGIEPTTFWCAEWRSNQLGHTGQGNSYLSYFYYQPVFVRLCLCWLW